MKEINYNEDVAQMEHRKQIDILNGKEKELDENAIYNGDCFEVMQYIKDETIDLILCDLPYGTTACAWDAILPFDYLWKAYERIIKPNGSIVLFASQPFTSALIMSNPKLFKYSWVWDKKNATGHLNAKARPLKLHEDIIVFSKAASTSTSKKMVYNPQGLVNCDITKVNFETETTGKRKCREKGKEWKQTSTGYPKTIISYPYDKEKLHPTQKPLELLKYLIKTYTNEGDVVLDNCMGSGSTCVAAKQTNRTYIGIEKEEKYFKIASRRLNEKLS